MEWWWYGHRALTVDWLRVREFMHQHGWDNWDCSCAAKDDERMMHGETCSVTPIYSEVHRDLGGLPEWPLAMVGWFSRV
jgi:hypothetical protein